MARWLVLALMLYAMVLILAAPATSSASPDPSTPAAQVAPAAGDDDDDDKDDDHEAAASQPAAAPAPAPAPAPAAAPAPAPQAHAAVDASPFYLRGVTSRRGTVRFHATRAGQLVLRARRLDGRRRGATYTRKLTVHAGTNVIRLREWFWGRRYRATLTCFDAIGNASRPVELTLRVR